MNTITLNSRGVATSLVVAAIAVAVAATIGYNTGFSHGTRVGAASAAQSGGTAGTPTGGPRAGQPTGAGAAETPAEVPVAGGPVEISGKTILNGTMHAPSAAGFTLDVVTQVLNTTTRRLTPKTTTYHVLLTKATKLLTQTSTITIPYSGAVPQVTSTTKAAPASELQEGRPVTVTTNDPAANQTITATEVLFSSVVQK